MRIRAGVSLYGLGGDWINIGLPMYIALDRKPEHGCEIQILGDGQSGIMFRLLLVKLTSSAFWCAADAVGQDNSSIYYGTHILKYLVQPWARSNHAVYAYSFFASFQITKELY